MTQTVALPEHRRTERNKQRVFANELIDALRGIHTQARVMPVVIGEIDEPVQARGKAPAFRTLGGHRGSKWSRVDYAALVLSPQWADADGTAYQIVLKEHDFEAVRNRLELKGWACGDETFQLSARRTHPPKTWACLLCELLHSRQQVFRSRGDEMVRNDVYIQREQATIALLLLERATVTEIKPSLN